MKIKCYDDIHVSYTSDRMMLFVPFNCTDYFKSMIFVYNVTVRKYVTDKLFFLTGKTGKSLAGVPKVCPLKNNVSEGGIKWT